jgi:hypothetical protein
VTPEGAAFDSFLRRTVADIAVTPSPLARRILPSRLGADNMPDIGGKKFADDFRGALGSMRKVMDEVKLEIAGAVTEFHVEARGGGKAVVKQIRANTDEVKRGFQDLLGNEPPETETVTVSAADVGTVDGVLNPKVES